MTASRDATTTPEVSDWDAAGGLAAMSVVVDQFYVRVVNDPELLAVFRVAAWRRETNVAALITKFVRPHTLQLLGVILGRHGAVYEGRQLREAHAGLGITAQQHRKVCSLLLAVMVDLGVPGRIVGKVAEALAGTRADIVGGAAP